MIEISSFKENTDTNNRVIQHALRDTDMNVLVGAFTILNDSEKEIFYRNMSKRACQLIAEEIEKKEHTISEKKANMALDYIKQRLNKFSKVDFDQDSETIKLPTIQLNSEVEILQTFEELSKFIKLKNVLELETLNLDEDNEIFKKGLEFLIDDWEPLLSSAILEQYKKRYLEKIENRINMMIAGFESLSNKELTFVLKERLKSFL